MTTLYSCPKCGTAMEDPTTVFLPTREQLLAELAQAVRLLAEARNLRQSTAGNWPGETVLPGWMVHRLDAVIAKHKADAGKTGGG